MLDGKAAYGYNARTGEYEDLIINPAKVTRVALENAAAIAGMVLMTECAINDLPEPKKEAAPACTMECKGDFGNSFCFLYCR